MSYIYPDTQLYARFDHYSHVMITQDKTIACLTPALVTLIYERRGMNLACTLYHQRPFVDKEGADVVNVKQGEEVMMVAEL